MTASSVLPLRPLFGPDGARIPPGRVVESLSWSTLGATALPDWLDHPESTRMTIDGDGVLLEAPTPNGSTATVEAAFTIDSTKYRAIRLSLQGLISPVGIVVIGLAGTDCGARIVHSTTPATLRFLYPTSQVETHNLTWMKFLGLAAPLNVGLEVWPREGYAHILYDDEVVGSFDATNWTDGTLAPRVQMVSNGGVTGSLAFKRLDITAWRN